MRLLSTLLAAALIFACSHAFAQASGLAGVTMRVVDDLSGIDAVVLVLELEAAPAPADNTEDAPDAERPAAEERESDDAAERDDTDSAERPVPRPPA